MHQVGIDRCVFMSKSRIASAAFDTCGEADLSDQIKLIGNRYLQITRVKWMLKNLRATKKIIVPNFSVTDTTPKFNTCVDFTIVCISNRPMNFARFVSQFRDIPIQIISVIPDKTMFETLKLDNFNIMYIESKSKNFSYLVNLGCYHVKTTYYVILSDDEEVNDHFFEFLFNYNEKHESIAIKCIGCYGDEQLRYWTGLQPRIFRKGVDWKYRVHEKPILHEKPIERNSKK